MFSGIENNPIVVDLVALANTTGWSISGTTATHVACNSGLLTLTAYPVIAGHEYSVSYTIISGSGVNTIVGGTYSPDHLSPDIIVDTITAGVDGFIQLYSETDVSLQLLSIADITQSISDAITIVYSTENKKWSDFRNLYPEMGVSLNQRTILAHNGVIYVQENFSEFDRNNFFGIQYVPKLTFVEAKDPQLLKTYNSLVIQANQVLVTTASGITTSLSQVSEVSEIDFVKGFLGDNNNNIVYANESVEGIYSASFLRDKNVDLQNGPQLKGNYIIIELTTSYSTKPVKIFTVAINASQSKIGPR